MDQIKSEKTILWQTLDINLFFFLLGITAGFLANSMGLVADNLDMLADAMVYALVPIVACGSHKLKKKTAGFAGIFQMALAIAVLRKSSGVLPDRYLCRCSKR